MNPEVIGLGCSVHWIMLVDVRFYTQESINMWTLRESGPDSLEYDFMICLAQSCLKAHEKRHRSSTSITDENIEAVDENDFG